MLISDGDYILLVVEGKREKRFLVKVRKGESFHTHKGYIKFDDVIGKEPGSVTKTNTGARVLLLRPTTYDVMEKLSRATQIIYPKDAGFMIIKAGIVPGAKVLESGTGSGSMTIALSRAVGPEGRVYSYEKDERFYEVAKKNIERFSLGNVELKLRDIREGVDERDLDAAFLDLPEPWDVMDIIKDAIKPGSPVIVFVPSFEQVKRTVVHMRKTGFGLVEANEILIRGIESDEERTRPSTRMIGHTGFIISGRKLLEQK
ncbi:MAG: tRNA (adenine-N1)-methyltransferase [Candidatus Methanodesulfokora sp.]|nr:MAG: hypothetical protein C0200_06810 [Candidatus Korarchaeota archaeon]